MAICGVTPILNVSSVPNSMRWFESLGWQRGFIWQERGEAEPSFGSVCIGSHEIFLSKDDQGPRGDVMPDGRRTDGAWMSWWLESPAEVDAMHDTALSLGLTVTKAPTDEPWDTREFHLRHPDGHMFRISASTHDH